LQNPRTEPYRRGRTAGGVLLAAMGIVLGLAFACPLCAFADKPTYALDEDPIRLGNRALQERHWADAAQYFTQALSEDYQVPRALFGLAEIAANEGRYPDAEPLYREALARSGDDFPQARAGLGLLLLRLGRGLEAEREFDRALAAKPDLWEAQYGKARLLLDEEKWDAANQLLQHGAGLRGAVQGEDRYQLGMAIYYLAKEDLDRAEKAALRALNLNPTDPDTGTLVGRVYELRKAPTLAIDAYEKALDTPGVKTTAPILENLGTLYEKTGRFQEARDRYLEAVEVDSTYAPALKKLAVLFSRANQHDRAARTYLRYVLLEKTDVDALVGLAESCLEVGRYGQALEAARTALAIDPTLIRAQLAAARAGIHSDDDKDRLEAAERYAKLGGEAELTAEDWREIAVYEIKAGEYTKAEPHLARARELDPRDAEVRYQTGILMLKTARYREATTHLQEAVELNPRSAIYHLNLGIGFFGAKVYAQAVPSFREALELNPDLGVARLLLAQALAVSGSLDEAKTEYEKVLSSEPANAKALRGLAYCQIMNADYARASETYGKAVEADPGNADGWAGLGNAYLGLQDWENAEKALGRAKKIDPSNTTMQKGLELLNQARSAGGGG